MSEAINVGKKVKIQGESKVKSKEKVRECNIRTCKGKHCSVCGGQSHTAKEASFPTAKNNPERVRKFVSSEKINADILRKSGAVWRQRSEAPV